ncbi:MAG: hypothetical protein LBL01_07720 [Bifidobacteriaceae bacterium]|nr:hypothetical protein [Bifidobacteriaceae bacterium]
MTALRAELVRLAEDLPEVSVPTAIATLRALREVPEPPADQSAIWPPEWFGAVERADGPVAERIDAWLSEGFGADR